jgi:hypothetical protein
MHKDDVLSALDAARAATLAALSAAGTDVAQRVPEGHTWSAWMVLDHLRVLDEQVTAVVGRLTARARTSGAAAAPSSIAGLADLGTYEEGVMDAPSVPGMEPRDPAPPSTLDDARNAREALIAAVHDAWSVDSRDRRFPHPWIVPMNAYEWLLFAAVHERGHLGHIERILATAAQPSSRNTERK